MKVEECIKEIEKQDLVTRGLIKLILLCYLIKGIIKGKNERKRY